MRSVRTWVIICAVIFVFAAVWCAWILLRSHGDTVIISQNGKALYTIDLNKEDDRVIKIEYEGRVNTIEIKNGRIHMLEADCPDQTCVNTGWLEDIPIICLPNKLVIEFTDKAADAAAG